MDKALGSHSGPLGGEGVPSLFTQFARANPCPGAGQAKGRAPE